MRKLIIKAWSAFTVFAVKFSQVFWELNRNGGPPVEAEMPRGSVPMIGNHREHVMPPSLFGHQDYHQPHP